MDKKKKSVYFPGLNGLRFFAALAVIITHIELMKMKLGFKNVWKEPFFFELGSLGVYFFFVLSGFLITYLLLVENEINGTISLKDFYLRRIFRIWPLYYFILILGFFILPQFDFFEVPYFSAKLNDNFGNNLFLYSIILPNLAFSMYAAVPLIGQVWSIGIEEQFYMIWPVLFKKGKKHLIKTLILFTIGFIFLKGIILLLVKTYPDAGWLQVVKLFFAMSKMENMSIGALGACVLYYKKNYLLRIIYHKVTLVLSLIFSFLLIYSTPDFIQDGIHIVYAFLFLVIILNVSSNSQSFLKLENNILSFLGKISYGIYMYHLIAVFIVIKLLTLFFQFNYESLFENILLYLSSISLSVLISYLSYEYFEKKFIKIKAKFSKVISGDNAK